MIFQIIVKLIQVLIIFLPFSQILTSPPYEVYIWSTIPVISFSRNQYNILYGHK